MDEISNEYVLAVLKDNFDVDSYLSDDLFNGQIICVGEYGYFFIEDGYLFFEVDIRHPTVDLKTGCTPLFYEEVKELETIIPIFIRKIIKNFEFYNKVLYKIIDRILLELRSENEVDTNVTFDFPLVSIMHLIEYKRIFITITDKFITFYLGTLSNHRIIKQKTPLTIEDIEKVLPDLLEKVRECLR